MSIQPSSLDKHVVVQFKSGLREQQRELLQMIEKAEKEIREFAGPPPSDAIDVSCLAASKESLLRRCSQDHRRLRLVEQALERIKDGSFGNCEECEGPIGLKRLQIVPWARNCIHCQSDAEARNLGQHGILASSF